MTLEKLRVAVVRGGNTPSYTASLKTGESILKALRDNERYSPVDIFVDQSGTWHQRGVPIEWGSALGHIDLVWNVSGGAYGEGRLEQLLEAQRIPYIGSGAVPGALADSIRHSREIYTREKMPTIRYEMLHADTFDNAALVHVFRNFLHPVTVRLPYRESHFGTKVAHSFQELESAVRSAFVEGAEVVVEEYIKGKEALASVLENARGEKLYSLLPAELRTDRIIAPGNFTPEEKRAMGELAKQAHQALGLRHYSASRFVITPRGTMYILETQAVPELSADSAFGKSLQATGWKDTDFVEHLITQVNRN